MSSGNFALGLSCCAVSAIGFGSNYLPVKNVDCGDGIFFAVCMAFGIGIVGLALNYSQATTGAMFEGPDFEPFAMIGGAAWMAGNLLTPTVIRLIGLGVGLSVWDMSNMVMGWATGYFGLFGVWGKPAATPWLNFLGVGLAGVSLVLLAQSIEEEPPAPKTRVEEGGRQRTHTEPAPSSEASEPDLELACPEENEAAGVAQAVVECANVHEQPSADGLESTAGHEPSHASVDSYSASTAATPCESIESPSKPAAAPGPRSRQSSLLVGLPLALLAGVLFGFTFTPSEVLVQAGSLGDERFSESSMDYVLSNFAGILAMAAATFAVYVCALRERAYVRRELIMPGLMSGGLWAVAQAAWFKANEELGMVVAFPIISTLPGVVALFWGVCLFGELRTSRSRRFASAALALRVPSVLCIALSSRAF